MSDRADGLMGRVPPAAKWLGLAGLLPFAAGALAVVGLPAGETGVGRALLAGYAAAILSFLGGCRWGFASAGMGDGPRFVPLAISVLPPLYAWSVMTLEDPARLLLLAVGFFVLYAGDVILTKEGGAPAWWPALRMPLTTGAVVALLVAAIAG